jgi:hypothetical protein
VDCRLEQALVPTVLPELPRKFAALRTPSTERGHFAVADVASTIEREAGAEPWHFHTTYKLRCAAEGWLKTRTL